jgi:hypothetical protein
LGDIVADRMDTIIVNVDMKDDIKRELRDFCGYDIECIHLALDRDMRLAFVKEVMNSRAP